MQKNYLFFSFILITTLISCQQSKEDRIKEYKAKCIKFASMRIDRDFARTGFLVPIDSFKVLFEDNCQCKAEMLVNHFSNSEMEKLDQLPEYQEQQIINPVINSCIIDLEKASRQFLEREKERQQIYIDALKQKSTPNIQSTPRTKNK